MGSIAMTEPSYKTFIREALEELEKAIVQATSLLPDDLVKQHWVIHKHAIDISSAWDQLQWRYLLREDSDEDIAGILSDLVMLTRSRAALKIIVEQVKKTEPDISLPRVRRTP